jgi:hypothetical protein
MCVLLGFGSTEKKTLCSGIRSAAGLLKLGGANVAVDKSGRTGNSDPLAVEESNAAPAIDSAAAPSQAEVDRNKLDI